MRLINTRTLEVEEFFDIYVPEYAILSHTWSDGELSLQEWGDRKNRRFKPGHQKIMWACAEASKDKLDYVWVDTNCIDKTSSAELSEAINSMFKWYRRSQVCYVHLEDVPPMTLKECVEPGSAFRKAKWFTRGWTLQELIAPPNINFFSRDWTLIATKSELAPCIAEITRIPWSCLLKGRLSKSHPLRRYSIAQRMSWASHRSTTRLEDQSYSLLGLFDISMPLVYGEGHEAFARLLEEIIHKYPDHSFFASQLRYVDFLPRSPLEFCDSHSVVTSSSPQLQRYYVPVYDSYPFHLTNTGLQMTLPVVPTLVPRFVFGVLDSWDFETSSTRSTRSVSRIWVPLLQKGPPALQQYVRLLWPQIFFPVKLIPKHSVLGWKRRNENNMKSASDSESPAAEGVSRHRVVEYVDPVSIEMYKSLLIRKPYATTLSVPLWQPREAGSPFILCFPRGTEDYRLYGIFSDEGEPCAQWSATTPPHPPLVMPRRMHRKTRDTGRDGGTVSTDETGQADVYGAVVVFKKRQSRPGKLVALCLCNIGQPDRNDNDRIVFRPGCKIIHGWERSKDQDQQSIDFDALTDTDVDGEMLVTVQKVSSNLRTAAKGSDPRCIVLTQVVFDRMQLLDEVNLSSRANGKEPGGLLQYYGLECSDEEVGNLI